MAYRHKIESIVGQDDQYHDLRNVFERAITKTINDAIFDLRKRSRGGFTYEALDAMGNPYSARNPGGLASLSLVSRHSAEDKERKKSQLNFDGNLYDEWKVKGSTDTNVVITNTAPYAKFVFEGTAKMVPRGGWNGAFMDKIEADMYKRFERNFAQELKRAK